MAYTKYSKEILQAVVSSSTSIAGVLRLLNLRPTGGSHANIKRRLKDLQIDTSHFTGKGSNRGSTHKGGSVKRNAKDLLVARDPLDRPEATYRIRRALLEVGVLEKCSECPITNVWNGKPYKLQIDHRNGQRWDNRLENLRFICHNCHSQTENFGSKNRRSSGK